MQSDAFRYIRKRLDAKKKTIFFRNFCEICQDLLAIFAATAAAGTSARPAVGAMAVGSGRHGGRPPPRRCPQNLKNFLCYAHTAGLPWTRGSKLEAKKQSLMQKAGNENS